MNRFKEIDLLIEVLDESLGGDEFEDVCFYLEEFKRLKLKELKELNKADIEQLLMVLKRDIDYVDELEFLDEEERQEKADVLKLDNELIHKLELMLKEVEE